MVHEHLEKYGVIGAENAISMQELSQQLSVTRSTLKKIVRDERIGGALICSNASGYYMPCCRAEIAECYDTMRRAAIRRLETIKPFRMALHEQEGQQGLFQE